MAPAHRDEPERRGLDLCEKLRVLLVNGREHRLVVADQIHLVHHHQDLPDAQHRGHEAVTAGVLAHPFAGVDHQDRRLGAGGAGDHVLQELHVPGRVDDDVAAPRGSEEHAGRVDGDALRLLVAERVDQERVLERLARALAVAPHLLDPAVRERAGVVQQASHHRALAVVDVADDDDVHRRQIRGRGRCGLRGEGAHRFGSGTGHYMYPSRRRVSSVPSPSLSCSRPARSATCENLPVRSSSTISFTVEAVDSTGVVQG